MKLNPKKCIFGVRSSKFLGYMFSEGGIEANPENVQAILDMREPRTIKDIQKLVGRMAAMSRFISKSAEKSQPFFKALKIATKIDKESKRQPKYFWKEEQSQAFQQLKEHLKTLPLLARPEVGEILYLYIVVSGQALSAVLLREENKVQQPIYVPSHTLTGPESRYPLIEKCAYAVVMANKKLKPYFDAHPIVVLTDIGLDKSLEKLECSGRMLKWAVELSGFGIKYQLRTTIKGQALADFISECSYSEEGEVTPAWQLHTDGSATSQGSGAGIVLVSPGGKVTEYALKFQFKATNNEAEYEAVLAGLELCKSLGAGRIKLFTDSQLVVNQIRGEYEVRDDNMERYLSKVK